MQPPRNYVRALLLECLLLVGLLSCTKLDPTVSSQLLGISCDK